MTRSLLAVLGCCLALSAQAAGTLVYQQQNPGERTEQIRIEHSGDNFRVETARHAAEGHLLLRGNKAYAVLNTGGAQPTVMDLDLMAQLARQLGQQGKSLVPGLESEKLGRFIALSAPGERTTVAGVPGRIYQITVETPAGKREQHEIVLTDDPRIADPSQSFLQQLVRVQKLLGQHEPSFDALVARLQQDHLGLLRVGNQLVLQQVSQQTPADARFALPAQSGVSLGIPGLDSNSLRGLAESLQRSR